MKLDFTMRLVRAHRFCNHTAFLPASANKGSPSLGTRHFTMSSTIEHGATSPVQHDMGPVGPYLNAHNSTTSITSLRRQLNSERYEYASGLPPAGRPQYYYKAYERC